LQPEDIQIDTTNSSKAPSQTDSGKESAPEEAPSRYEIFRQMQLNQERDFLLKVIRECNGSVREAAKQLGLFRTALYNRLNHLGVNIKEIKN
jgi:DNA-binding NtrC family response regulator